MKAFFTSILFALAVTSNAQEQQSQNMRYPIGAEFLIMNTDVKSAGMGNLRTVGQNDANSVFSNAARVAFDRQGLLSDIGVSYNPIAQNLAKDIKLMSLAGNFYVGGGDYSAAYVSGFVQFFGLGDVFFTDQQGNEIDYFRPKEYAIGGTFSKRYGEYFALSLTAKGIYSRLGANRVVGGMQDATAFAADVGIYSEIPMSDATLSFGLTAINLGTKLNYGGISSTNLPSGIRLGTGYRKALDDYDQSYFFIGGEVSKSLVSYIQDANSFSDGALAISLGTEMMFNEKFGFRGGYSKDNFVFNRTNAFTLGVTLATFIDRNKLGIDLAYQMPGGKQTIGLSNMFKFGLTYSFFD